MGFLKKRKSNLNHNELVDIKVDVTWVAKHAHMQYLQFIAEGFSEEQAMQLTVAILKNN